MSLRIIPLLAETWNTILDFIYPPYCVCCEVRLAREEFLVCHICWQKNNQTGFLKRINPRSLSLRRTPYWHDAGTVYAFHDCSRTLIHEFKFHGKTRLAARFGVDLGTVIARTPVLAQTDCLVPVPLHPARFRERGYNQSLLLAEESCRWCGIPVLQDGLLRLKNNRSQTGLNRHQRYENVAGIFRVPDVKAVRKKQIILIDDVMTTGVTLNECARVLADAGAVRVYAVALVHPDTAQHDV